MNKLNSEKREFVIRCLVEGTSIRGTERITGCHRDTIMRLMVRTGDGCKILLDEAMRGLTCERLQIDEIWSFVHKKQKNVPEGPGQDGDCWVFVALDPDTKLVPVHMAGKRTMKLAVAFLKDVERRLSKRVQISSDALKTYLDAVDQAFGDEVDYGQVWKPFEKDHQKGSLEISGSEYVVGKNSIYGKPDPRHISTSLIERQNLTMRMCMRRFTRRTNGFSKKIENHRAALSLHFAYYNFVRMHQTLRTTPAAKAGVLGESWSLGKLIKEAEMANERGTD